MGEIAVVAPSYQFGAEAIGGDHALFFMAGVSALQPFLDSAKSGGFEIIRKGTRVVGRYQAGDLADHVGAFSDCIKKHFDQPDDPFAD